jgi:WD40 repeat protein
MYLMRAGIALSLFVGVLLVGGSTLAAPPGLTAILSRGRRGGAAAQADPTGARRSVFKGRVGSCALCLRNSPSPAVPDGVILARFGDGPLLSVVFDPLGKRLAVVEWNGTIRILAVPAGKEELRIAQDLNSGSSCYSVIFSPDGKVVSTAGAGSTIRQWNSTSGEELSCFDLFNRANELGSPPPQGGYFPVPVAFSPDGRLLAVETPLGNEIGFVVLDSVRGKVVAKPPIDHVTDSRFPMKMTGGRAAFSPDSATLAYSSFSESVTIWDINKGVLVRKLTDSDSPLSAVSFSPDGKLVAACAGGRGLRTPGISSKHMAQMHANFILMWEVGTGKLRYRLEGHEDRVLALAFSPDGKLMLSGGADGTMRIWEVFSGRQLCNYNVGGGAVNCVAVSPDGQRIATASSDGRVSLFPTSTISSSELLLSVDQETFERLWHDLASEQAIVAYDAVQQLSVRSNLVLEQFRKRIGRVEGVGLATITARIADLDADDFDRREAASKELAALGAQAEPALRKALDEKPSAEARARIEKLLKPLNQWIVTDPDTLRALRAIWVLQRIGTPEARAVLEDLAKGAPEVRQTQEAKAALDFLDKHPAAKP